MQHVIIVDFAHVFCFSNKRGAKISPGTLLVVKPINTKLRNNVLHKQVSKLFKRVSIKPNKIKTTTMVCKGCGSSELEK